MNNTTSGGLSSTMPNGIFNASISQDLTGTPGVDSSGDVGHGPPNDTPQVSGWGLPSIPNPFSGIATNLEFGAGGLAAGVIIAVIIYMAIKF